MSDGVLLTSEPAAGVRLLILNRPEVRNALNVALLERLTEELAAADADREVGCIVLGGAGSAFCSGGDIAAQLRLARDARPAYLRRYAGLGMQIQALTKPLVAAVQGHALAGGFELACACDIRVLARDAIVGVEDVEVGLSPTTGLTWTLQRHVGLGNALYLTLHGARIDGERAFALGLAQELADDAESVVPRAVALAASIASKPGRGVALSRAATLLGSQSSHAAATEYETRVGELTFDDPGATAAFEAFLSRRTPRSGTGEASAGE